jgi:leucyl aminopeptidase
MPIPTIKPVQLQYKPGFAQLGTDLLAVFIDEDQIEGGQLKSTELKNLDQSLGGIICNLVKLGDFSGKWMQTSQSIVTTSEVARRVMLVGGGKKTDRSAARAREFGMKVGEYVTDRKVRDVALLGFSQHLREASQLAQSAIGLSMGVYKYPALNQTPETRIEAETPVKLCLVGAGKWTPQLASETESIMAATTFCRYLQDSPPNVATPKRIAEWAAERASSLGLKVTIRGRSELEKLGFGAMLAVSSGSAQEPQFVVIEHAPAGAKKTLALVGKGLTMDTGGYSLKTPSTNQVGMQYDMSGAAVVLASVLAIAEQKLPVKVFAVAALVENMVDAHAYRVNDVIKTYSGKTVEIRNTDAEGRVVLCDALSFVAKELKPDLIVEYSTLTGAMVVSLGNYAAGVFSYPDDKPAKVVEGAAEASGERVWTLPVWEEAFNDIKTSPVADLTNIGATAGSAGSIVAAAYLFEFVESTPFAHVDIAGVAYGNAAIGHPRKSGSGYGVQLSYQIARSMGS